MDELGVVGLDLTAGREVSIISETDVPYWRRRGLMGDQSVVCLHCYDGTDGPRARVPLVAKGRIGGQRRPHFAHPPGYGPPHGIHHPESVWHAAGKQELADWARTQPDVADVRVEAWTHDGRRRSDVQIRFNDGARVALELQSAWLTDDDWLRRHHDYTGLGITDIWLWHTRHGLPGIIREHHQPGWLFSDDRAELVAVLGAGCSREDGWWQHDDLSPYQPHWPAQPHERTRRHPLSYAALTLTRDGITLPNALLNSARRATRAEADRCRQTTSALGEGPTPLATVAARGQEPDREPPSWPTAVVRIDAHPPGCDPTQHLYLCRPCSKTFRKVDLAQHEDCVEHPTVVATEGDSLGTLPWPRQPLDSRTTPVRPGPARPSPS